MNRMVIYRIVKKSLFLYLLVILSCFAFSESMPKNTSKSEHFASCKMVEIYYYNEELNCIQEAFHLKMKTQFSEQCKHFCSKYCKKSCSLLYTNKSSFEKLMECDGILCNDWNCQKNSFHDIDCLDLFNIGKCSMHSTADDDLISSSKRLILSLCFVLVLIIVLLLFSKSFRVPQTDNQNARWSLRYFLSRNEFARPETWTSRYWSRSETTTFFDADGLPVVYNDCPPPYSSGRLTPNRLITSDRPPSYISNFSSVDSLHEYREDDKASISELDANDPLSHSSTPSRDEKINTRGEASV